MYIVRWLMGHPIIAIWVLGAIAILLQEVGGNNKHEEVSGSHVVKSSDVVINGTPAVITNAEVKHEFDKAIESVGGKKLSDIQDATTLPSDGSIVSLASSSVDESDGGMAQEVPNEDETDNDEESESSIAVSVEENAGVGDSGTVAVLMAVTADASDEHVAKISSTEAPAAEHEPVATTTTQADLITSAQQVMPDEGSDIGQMSADEILLMAREAYWNNGLDEAAELYIQLIKLQPNIMEYKGELGNVYWRQGFSKKAAELYSEIAIPMLQRGDVNRVANMLGFIGLFYPDRAAEISQKIMLMQNNNQ